MKRWFLFIGASFSLHIFVGGGVGVFQSKEAPEQTDNIVKIKVNEQKKELEEKPKVEKKELKKPKQPKVAGHRTNKKKKKDKSVKPQPIAGLTKESFAGPSESSKSITAPAGNTGMAKDLGIRKNFDEIGAIDEDLSSDAILIQKSISLPEYTDEALEIELSGRFVVDVFVDEEGLVVEAEMRKPVGYGMDERILSVAKQARFSPRKNRFGRAVKGWAEIVFRLKIDR